MTPIEILSKIPAFAQLPLGDRALARHLDEARIGTADVIVKEGETHSAMLYIEDW
jgi:hypothetical protein